jgi:MSHA biogenesis protein MshK
MKAFNIERRPGLALGRYRLVKSALCACAGLLLLGQSAVVCAEAGPDPTRPPQSVQAPEAEGAQSGLQSVLISDRGRAAVINGQLVEQGQKYGDATLTRVTESEVTLVSGRETKVLRLFPAVEKKMLTAAPESVAPVEAKKKKNHRKNTE